MQHATTRRKRLAPAAIGAGVTILVTAAYVLLLVREGSPVLEEFVRALDARVVDAFFQIRGPRRPTGEVVLVDIDETSLHDPALGQWPWPRDRVAALLERIHAGGPRALGLDIVFAEPDRTSPARALDSLAPYLRTRPDEDALEALDHDRILGNSLKDTPTVLGYFFLRPGAEVPPGAAEAMPFPTWTLKTEPPGRQPEEWDIPRATGAILNAPAIADWAASEGFFNIDLRRGASSVKRVPVLMRLGGLPLPSLALEALRIGQGASTVRARLAGGRTRNILGLQVGDLSLPTDGRGRVTLNYRGPAGTFPHYSAAAVYHGRVPPEAFAGRYVLLGASAGGLHDLKPTPFDPGMPGMEVQATLIDNAIAGDALRRSTERERGFLAVLLLAGGVLFTLALVRVGPLHGLFVALGVFALLLTADYAFFHTQLQVVGVSFPLAGLGGVYLAVTVSRYVLVGREARFIRNAFGHYLAPEVVEELVERPEALTLGGERRCLTVLFSDVRGFTTLSESMDPEALGALLNEYMTAMTRIVMARGGTVDKFIGDALMAFWGAPLAREKHPHEAVGASLAMLQRLDALRAGWQQRGLPAIDVGIGVNTGEMNVGNMGSEDRFDYTVIGDHVNLASRLEGLNKTYGTRLLVSEFTRERLGEAFFCRRVDRVRVKGREDPVAIYEPLCEGRPADRLRARAEAFRAAQEAFYARRFEEAAVAFAPLAEDQGDPLARVFLERVTHFRHHPPPEDWDGVWTFTTK